MDGARILVVDDADLIRRSIRRVLDRAGAIVLEEADHNSGLSRAFEDSPDAALIDVTLPGGSGIDLCRSLRADPRTNRMPVIIMTGAMEADVHARALEAGADDFISKPFNTRVLLARVHNLVARRRAEAATARLTRELKRYISKAALDHAVHQATAQRLQATILFSDLRGFTAASYSWEPEAVFTSMNAVLARQTELVLQCGGYVDKYSGDGMMAVFSGPRAELQACAAATEIVKWARHAKIAGWDPLPIGMGIHAGVVMRGDLGSENRREFTVLGRAVNIAARLCGIAAANEVIVSPAVVQVARTAYNFADARTVSLKGIPEPMNPRPLIVPED